MTSRRSFLSALFAAPVLAFVSAFKAKPLPRPEPDGISIRMIRNYDPTLEEFVTRFDVLYGFAPMRYDYAARLEA